MALHTDEKVKEAGKGVTYEGEPTLPRGGVFVTTASNLRRLALGVDGAPGGCGPTGGGARGL